MTEVLPSFLPPPVRSLVVVEGSAAICSQAVHLICNLHVLSAYKMVYSEI